MSEPHFKPRNEHLYQVLVTRKGGPLQDKKGTKHQSRARSSEEFREMIKSIDFNKSSDV